MLVGGMRPPLSLERWIENLFRPTVIAGMMTSVVISVVALVHRVDPSWGGAYLVLFTFLVVWEAIQSERVLKHSEPGRFNRARFRFTEWVIIMLFLKLASYTELGLKQLLVDVPRWFHNLNTFFNGGYILSAALLSLLWLLGIFIAQDLYVLEVHPSELRPRPTSSKFYLWMTRPRSAVNRGAALRRIVASFFWGGLLLIICTGLARYDIPQLFPDRPPPTSGLVLNVMAYFLLGLALISQAHYSVLHARWQLREVEIEPNIGTRWAILAALFLTMVIAIALLLPTGYSIGLPQAITLAIHVVVRGLMYAVILVISVPVFLINLIASLLFQRQGPMLEAPRGSLPMAPPETPERGPGLSIWPVVRDLLLWALLAGIVAYSFYNFLGDRRRLLRGLFSGGVLAWLRQLLDGLLGGTRRAVERARQRAEEGLRSILSAKGPRLPWRYISLSSLSPRQLILYFYLSIVRRAEGRGLGRRPWQTPYEYSERLRAELPEHESDVAELTEAFVDARYSPRSVTQEEANLVKRSWRRVRRALRRWRLGPE
ncbi:MAG: DUF4129 domain-containing protein [Chloroflexota bacterium]|nr:DUF4129 domain-containing protein [Chloroflexota bacterium]